MSTFLLTTRWNIVNRESFCLPSRDGNSSFSSMNVALYLAGTYLSEVKDTMQKEHILVQVLLGYINVQIYIAMRYNFPFISNAAVVVICRNFVNGNVVYAQTWEVLTLKNPLKLPQFLREISALIYNFTQDIPTCQCQDGDEV